MQSVNQSSLTDILSGGQITNASPPSHKKGERFLKGPIPWKWITEAASISGNAVRVSMAIWHLAGMMKTDTVKLSNKILAELGVDRSGKYRTLDRLETAGLISLKKRPGCSPEVTILKVSS
jgi:DNA-binding MarR family transcriptional regulator